MEMIAHQVASDAAKRLLDAGDLGDDVGAVAIFFDHFLETANLAFNAAESLEIGVLQLRIDGDGLATFGRDAAGAVGGRDVPGNGVCRNLGRHQYPQGLYIPHGAIGCQTMPRGRICRFRRGRALRKGEGRSRWYNAGL